MSLACACLCGAIRFTATPADGAVTACHCSQCRKLSGNFSASFDCAAPAYSQGQPAEYATPNGGTRGFCATCGASLWFRDRHGAWSVEAGSVEGATALRLSTHIFTADRGDYYTIADGLPQFAQSGEP